MFLSRFCVSLVLPSVFVSSLWLILGNELNHVLIHINRIIEKYRQCCFNMSQTGNVTEHQSEQLYKTWQLGKFLLPTIHFQVPCALINLRSEMKLTRTQKLISRIDELHGKERGICTQICEGSANNHIRLQDAQVNQFESETTGYDYVICCMGVCIYN
ncbi:hypothetical protein GmHk_18G052237 [Glycine max]|nr:hypothetical protein GmHk_18G052237 [Glycine max]